MIIPHFPQNLGDARAWEGTGVWEYEGTAQQGSGRNRNPGADMSLGGWVQEHVMGQEPGMGTKAGAWEETV